MTAKPGPRRPTSVRVTRRRCTRANTSSKSPLESTIPNPRRPPARVAVPPQATPWKEASGGARPGRRLEKKQTSRTGPAARTPKPKPAPHRRVTAREARSLGQRSPTVGPASRSTRLGPERNCLHPTECEDESGGGRQVGKQATRLKSEPATAARLRSPLANRGLRPRHRLNDRRPGDRAFTSVYSPLRLRRARGGRRSPEAIKEATRAEFSADDAQVGRVCGCLRLAGRGDTARAHAGGARLLQRARGEAVAPRATRAPAESGRDRRQRCLRRLVRNRPPHTHRPACANGTRRLSPRLRRAASQAASDQPTGRAHLDRSDG